jgi:hypothetical protein
VARILGAEGPGQDVVKKRARLRRGSVPYSGRGWRAARELGEGLRTNSTRSQLVVRTGARVKLRGRSVAKGQSSLSAPDRRAAISFETTPVGPRVGLAFLAPGPGPSVCCRGLSFMLCGGGLI